jgi:hypothetical protein
MLRNVAASFQGVKHEAQIIQSRSGDDGDGRNREFYREILDAICGGAKPKSLS